MTSSTIAALVRGWPSAETLRRIAAVLAVAGAVLAHVVAARDGSGPVWAQDEIGQLANAKVAAAAGDPWSLSRFSYYPGWSIVIAPAWWFTADPATVYRAAVVVGVVAAIVSIWPLTLIARRVGLSTPVALTVAAVVTMAPARALMSNYVVSENFLVLMTAVTAVTAARFFDRPTMLRAVAMASASAYTYFTHARALPVIVASLIAFGFAARRSARSAVVGAGVVVVMAGVAWAANAGIVGQTYDSASGRDLSALAAFTETSLSGFGRALASQLWYQLAAWLGLSILGLLVVGRAARDEIRRRTCGTASWATLTIFGLVGMTGVFLGRALTDPDAVTRLDYWFYGRYLDPFLAPFAVIGLAALIARRGDLPVRALIGVTSVISVVYAFLVLPDIDQDLGVAVLNPPGVLVWGEVFGAIAGRRTVLTCLLVAVALALAAARTGVRGRFLIAPLAACFLLSTVVVDAHVVDPFNAQWRKGATIREVVDAAAPGGAAVAYDIAEGKGAEDNRAVFWLSPRRVDRFDSTQELPPHPVVISRWDWDAAASLGALRVGSQRFPNNAVWVLPGPEQDDLAARGYLERPEHAPRLRDHGYRLELQDPPTGAECATGGGCEVTIEVTNEGIDVWSPVGTRADDLGIVRVALWWVVDGAVAGTQYWDLERSVFPDETVTLTGAVARPPDLGAGPVSVQVGLVQQGLQGFPGPGDSRPALDLPAAVDPA